MDRLPEFAAFDYADKADAGPKWDKWICRLELLFTGMNIEDNGRKQALLLHYAGERVFDIYEAEKGETGPITRPQNKYSLSTFRQEKKFRWKFTNFETVSRVCYKNRLLANYCGRSAAHPAANLLRTVCSNLTATFYHAN
jgi:hypothetical protein